MQLLDKGSLHVRHLSVEASSQSQVEVVEVVGVLAPVLVVPVLVRSLEMSALLTRYVTF